MGLRALRYTLRVSMHEHPNTSIEGGKLLITTTPDIAGWRIVHYYGLVAGEAIIGANIVRDFFAGVRDIVGGRSATYERGLGEARQIASDIIRKRAELTGANAIVGGKVDYEVIHRMLMVSISGTAVRIEQVPNAT